MKTDLNSRDIVHGDFSLIAMTTHSATRTSTEYVCGTSMRGLADEIKID